MSLRDALTDYLRFALALTKPYRAIVSRLARALERTGATRIVDLCSGAGGPWPHLLPLLTHRVGPVDLCLTDFFPNVSAFIDVQRRVGGQVGWRPGPVDATDVPQDLPGFRTLFTGLHHLPPDAVRRFPEDAVSKGQGIGAFEFTERSISAVLGMLPAPVIALATIPFVRPFRLSRILWTYVPPVLPLVVAFDGIASCLRTYSVEELVRMTEDLAEYEWDVGIERVPRTPMRVTYLVGTPRREQCRGGRAAPDARSPVVRPRRSQED